MMIDSDLMARRALQQLGVIPGDGALFSTFEPLEWQKAPLLDKSPVICLTGSAGGGKSRLAGELIHNYLWQYPGATALALRKKREFASKSIVPFFWESVVGGDNHGVTWLKSHNTFRYSNGSVLYIAGMADQTQREAVRSIGGTGGVSISWLEEADAFDFEDFQEVRARLRQTVGDYRQIILSCNPSFPNHWINQKMIIGGGAAIYRSGAIDNPHNPDEYLDILDQLTGLQRERLHLGLWVQSTGTVYPDFSAEPGGNVSADAEYNPDWPVLWGCDDGYSAGDGIGSASYHPRFVVFAQETPVGGLNVFDEYHAVREMSEKTLQNALQRPYNAPDVAYVDSSAAELKSRIWATGCQTIGGSHKITEGVKVVRGLICDAQGVRLLKVHPRCTHTIAEFQSYAYRDDGSKGVFVGEPAPEKKNDHSMDALRYVAFARLRFH